MIISVRCDIFRYHNFQSNVDPERCGKIYTVIHYQTPTIGRKRSPLHMFSREFCKPFQNSYMIPWKTFK